MSYESALEAAGAKILAFEQFGSHQGEWYALVEYNGERGWVNGSYGSCSGCDSFEAEFGYSDYATRVGESIWADGEYRPATEADVAKSAEKLAAFGKPYLDGLLTQEQAEAEAARYIEWDSEAPAMLAFVKAHAESRP